MKLSSANFEILASNSSLPLRQRKVNFVDAFTLAECCKISNLSFDQCLVNDKGIRVVIKETLEVILGEIVWFKEIIQSTAGVRCTDNDYFALIESRKIQSTSRSPCKPRVTGSASLLSTNRLLEGTGYWPGRNSSCTTITSANRNAPAVNQPGSR